MSKRGIAAVFYLGMALGVIFGAILQKWATTEPTPDCAAVRIVGGVTLYTDGSACTVALKKLIREMGDE